jgi:hypothetical protein
MRVAALELTAVQLQAVAPATLTALNLDHDHIATMWSERSTRATRNRDVIAIIGGGRSFVLMLAAIASPIIAIALLIASQHGVTP